MARRLFGPRRRRGVATLAVAAGTFAAALMAGLVVAHPGHEDEDAFEKMLATLTAQGKPCDEVVEIEDAPTAILVTCRVRAGDKGEQAVAYRLPK